MSGSEPLFSIGRTSFIKGDLATRPRWGRDHHHNAFTTWLAGGGTGPGFSFGEADDVGRGSAIAAELKRSSFYHRVAGNSCKISYMAETPFKLGRRFSFSLRALLLTTLVISSGLGLLLRERRQIAERREALERAGFDFPRLELQVQPAWRQLLLGDDWPAYTTSLHGDLNERRFPFAHLQRLTQLKSLLLTRGHSVVDVDLVNLRQLSQLEYLDLRDTKITDAGIADLTGLRGLHTLVLEGAPLTGIGLSHLSKLRDLTLLCANDTQFTDDGLAAIAQLTQLEVIDIARTRITDAGLVHLTKLAQLTTLSVSGNQITDTGAEIISTLPALSELQIYSTPLTDAGLAHLERLKSLEVIYVEFTKTTHDGRVKFKAAVPNCRMGHL